MHTDTYIQNLIKDQSFFEIHQETVLGIEMEVFKNRPRSLVDFIELSVSHGDQPYLIYEDRVISFEQHFHLVKRIAYLLVHSYGIKPGDRVAIYAANAPEWIIFFWATVGIGAIVCGLNGWWKGEEAINAINYADPKLVVVDSKRYERIKDDLNYQTYNFEISDLSELESELEEFIRVDEDDCACLLYTSGTTGTPKGVMTSHRSMIANSTLQMLQGAAVSQYATKQGIDWFVNNPMSLLTSPLFHVSGLSAGAVTSLFAGSTTILYKGRFNPKKVLDLIIQYKVTSWGGAVPTALKRVLDSADQLKLDLSSMLVIGGGGAPMPAELIDRTKKIFSSSRYSFGYGYGLTESGAITLVNWGEELEKNPSSPGQPMPTISVQLRDENNNLIKEDQKEGEIYVRSPSVMLGYFNNSKDSSDSLTNDRWLKTGDWGYKKGQIYFISSRRTDLILRGAENVYPQEIELILDLHPGVIESGVIGVPHDDLGEEVMAIVVTNNKKNITQNDLAQWVSSKLADFKVPSKWKLINENLPRNASGKLMKHVLIDASKNTMVEEDD